MKTRSALIFMTFVFIALPAAAAAPGTVRFRVIAPSSPVTDVYTPAAIMAVYESGEIAAGYRGDVWLWTDYPWVNPYHLVMKPEHKGIIVTPMKFNLPVMQRIEAYDPPSPSVHAWSNAVSPVKPDFKGYRLFWGVMEGGDDPVPDFRVADKDGPKRAEAKRRAVEGPLELRSVKARYRHETWIVIPDPSLEEAEQNRILEDMEGARTDGAALEAVRRMEPKIALIRGDLGSGPYRSRNLIPEGLAMVGKPGPPSPGGRMAGAHKEKISSTDLEHIKAVIPDRSGYIGVWAKSDKPSDIWEGLKSGRAYAAWGSRVIIDWVNGPGLTVAGNGPREEIEVMAVDGGAARKVAGEATDGYVLKMGPEAMRKVPSGSAALISVSEPWSPTGASAMAYVGLDSGNPLDP